MSLALALARRGLGSTSPNPSVGCVIVRDGVPVGRGTTMPGGRPHAEVVALGIAGDRAKGATAYVSLEPCCHHGNSPPCTDALIAAGVARVVTSAHDPDPRVAGKGLDALRAAGIAVTDGVLDDEGRDVTLGHILRASEGRPMVTLKLATSLDGGIAAPGGDSKWITGEAARAAAHGIRAMHDAILVGPGTAAADDPMLTCRLPGYGDDRQPLRVVLDPRGSLPATLALFRTADQVPTVQLVGDVPAGAPFPAVRQVQIPVDENGRAVPDGVLRALGALGVTRLMVEGGGQVAAALVRAGLVDRLEWFRAPVILGGDAVPAVAALNVAGVADAPRFFRVAAVPVGADMHETYRRAE